MTLNSHGRPCNMVHTTKPLLVQPKALPVTFWFTWLRNYSRQVKISLNSRSVPAISARHMFLLWQLQSRRYSTSWCFLLVLLLFQSGNQQQRSPDNPVPHWMTKGLLQYFTLYGLKLANILCIWSHPNRGCHSRCFPQSVKGKTPVVTSLIGLYPEGQHAWIFNKWTTVQL